mmetsp:Transcript_27040/g.44118  ORF Transcript_27040/g.44118 Transcript_27040/m.44118 type:complete len:560 (+) Transcript_27040:119-1798(+)
MDAELKRFKLAYVPSRTIQSISPLSVGSKPPFYERHIHSTSSSSTVQSCERRRPSRIAPLLESFHVAHHVGVSESFRDSEEVLGEWARVSEMVGPEPAKTLAPLKHKPRVENLREVPRRPVSKCRRKRHRHRKKQRAKDRDVSAEALIAVAGALHQLALAANDSRHRRRRSSSLKSRSDSSRDSSSVSESESDNSTTQRHHRNGSAANFSEQLRHDAAHKIQHCWRSHSFRVKLHRRSRSRISIFVADAFLSDFVSRFLLPEIATEALFECGLEQKASIAIIAESIFADQMTDILRNVAREAYVELAQRYVSAQQRLPAIDMSLMTSEVLEPAVDSSLKAIVRECVVEMAMEHLRVGQAESVFEMLLGTCISALVSEIYIPSSNEVSATTAKSGEDQSVTDTGTPETAPASSLITEPVGQRKEGEDQSHVVNQPETIQRAKTDVVVDLPETSQGGKTDVMVNPTETMASGKAEPTAVVHQLETDEKIQLPTAQQKQQQQQQAVAEFTTGVFSQIIHAATNLLGKIGVANHGRSPGLPHVYETGEEDTPRAFRTVTIGGG